MKPETVSLCVIAYNEEKIIGKLLADLKAQTWPHEKTQIVLVDGRSEDGTKDVMERFAEENRAEYLDITVVDNPRRIQAAGWNKAIEAAVGDVMIRIDAHAHIPAEFTALNMRDHRAGEQITGGRRPCITERDTPKDRMLLMVENSLFGSSIGKSRHSREKEYVKTLFHAAYRREIFDQVGGFNEGLLRTEDNELHYRMGQAGYRFCLDPEIISWQYARADVKSMIRQKYGNGYWIGTTLKICPGCISLYHLVPAAFVCGIILTTLLAVFGHWLLAAVMWILYGLFAVGSTLLGAKESGFSGWTAAAPFLFLILHVAYGVGTIAGLIGGKAYAAS